MEKKEVKSLVLIFFLALGIYYPVLLTYFSGDDFFHFKLALSDVLLNSFGFHPFDARGVFFYRPLFREVAYFISYQLFSLKAFPFRIFQFVLHFANVSLVYLFLRDFLANKRAAFLAAFLFGVGSANVGVLYYLAGGIQVAGATFFMLLTLLLFLKYLRHGVKNHLIFSFLTFLFGLMSHEVFAVTLPLLGILYFLKKKNLKKGILILAPFILVFGLYLGLNFFVIGVSNEVQYRAVFDIGKTLNTLFWYTAWAFGIPEMFVDFVGSGFKINPDLFNHWGSFAKIILMSSAVCLGLLLTSLKVKLIKDKKFLFFGLWFLGALAPVLFLPWHKQTYYLGPALVPFWGAVSLILISAKKVVRVYTLVFLLILSITSVKLADITYPAAKRGKIAFTLLTGLKVKFPRLPKSATLYIVNDPSYPFISEDWGGSSKQAFLVLSGENAVRLLYHDDSITVFYEDLVGKKPEGEVFEYVASFN